MSKQVKRSIILDFLENSAMKCEHCGYEEKIALRCRNCKAAVNLKNCHFFHLRPVSTGGSDTFSNIIMLCPKCAEKVDSIREKLRSARNKKLSSY